MKTKIIKRLLLLLLLMTMGVEDTWALWRNDISFEPVNRASKSGNVISSAGNAGNAYALALADLSELLGIKTVATMSISFEVNFSKGSRWQIGIGDKDVRRTNANGSTGSGYNSTGLILQIYDDGGEHYRVNINGNVQYYNNSSAFDAAYGRTVRVDLFFNKNTHKFNYSLTDVDNNTLYISGYNIDTSVNYLSIVEAYTWANNASVTLSNITINYNFFFHKSDETIYIEDIIYNNPLNNGENKPNVNISFDSSYLRRDGDNYYPIKTTGSQPTNVTEGNYLTVTANANDTDPTSFRVRIKTRNALDPSTMYDAATNTFDVGSTIGMLTSQVVNMDGIDLYLGYQGHTPVVRSINGGYGITIIDNNGWSFGNYAYEHEWGTVYKIEAKQARNLTISGYFATTSSDALQLRSLDNNTVFGTLSNPGDGSLTSVTFPLETGWYLLYVPGSVFALKSLSYSDAHFEKSYAVTTIGSTYTQAVSNIYNPTYSIVDMQGDVASTGVTINSSTGEVSNITAGGALKIQAAGGGKTAVYYLTIAYSATEYPGHQWNFCTDVNAEGNEVQRVLDVSDNLKTASAAGTTVYDSYGEEWVFVSGSRNHWFRTKAMAGDNAFCVKETNGLVFNTGERNFFLRSDVAEYTHIGIRGNGSSFTIPALAAGDIVEIMWRHENSNSGTKFAATNLTDLRGKDVDKEFLITESAQRGNSNIRFVGYYSFIVKGDGDVTFTLADAGNCDIQSIRIYKGPYRSTMRNINMSGNTPAPITMLLDNAEQVLTYNYCNQLYSTATGPAIYVLKGYRKNNGGVLGVDYDHEGCVSGTNAALSPVSFKDENAYPVSDAEKTRLYELRKNIIGLQMYNETWQSSNNSYNNGVIKATSGWGKVTIRMNNYTNDMEYLIGYTPDYTLTIGSAPHQIYPYTWDFTKIAGQRVTGNVDNVLNSIEAEGSNSNFSGAAPTNWFKNGNGQFMLNTDNSDDLGSQYVPGAVLVTQDCALSNFNGVEYDAKWAKDELDGLGFDGGITMHIDHLLNTSGWNRVAVADQWNSLLSFKITDAATFNRTGGTDEDPVGTWEYSKDLQTAGSGQIQLNHDDESNHIDESSIPSGGIGFRLDDGDSKYIRIVPSSPLQAGDVISVTAYNAYSNRDAGISFNKSALKTDVAQWKNLNGRLVEETLNYTVSTNDGLDGRKDFYLFRNTNTVHITAIEISRKASTIPNLDWCIYTLTKTTITVPDLNAGGKQDWIYVSSSVEPESVTNATKVTEGTDGPDANDGVYKYKVTAAGNTLLTFNPSTKIYKIGVTHILKDIHQVGNTGWATEIRKEGEHIDHELIGYFTKNDVNAYTVKYDSYDLNTATVALTPINEDGYVPGRTGIVMKLDNAAGLSSANAGKNVPLFYPSYTRPASSTAVDFPTNNLMYNVDEGIDSDNQNYHEKYTNLNGNGIDYTKFVLTNVHWTFHQGKTAEDEQKTAILETDAAGFYRLHIWQNDASKNVMPAHNAFLLVPTDNLPTAVWSLPSAGARRNTIAIRTLWGEETTAIEDVTLDTREDQPLDKAGGAWYTLSGMRLQSKPTVSGVYIHDGKKVVVNLRDR